LPAAAANPLAAIASSDKESNGALAKEKPTASKRKTALEEIMEVSEQNIAYIFKATFDDLLNTA
jgi:hypothetical protein